MPCPFCGGRDHLFIAPDEIGSGGQWVSPVHVGCSQTTGCGVSVWEEYAEDAIAKWNTRAHHASSNILVGLWKARANLRHHLMTGLTYRETSKDPKGNGFSFAEVPDWQLRQWIDAVEAAAQAIEARRAETLGSVHESAVRQDAPETPLSTPLPSGSIER